MRVRQGSEREPETGKWPDARGGGSGTAGGELRIHLHAGAQQQQIAFEGTEPEGVDQLVDGGGPGQRCAGGGHALFRGAGVFAREPRLQARELGRDIALVGIGPIGFQRRVH